MEDFYVEELSKKELFFKLFITLVIIVCAVLLGLYLMKKNTLHIKNEITLEVGSTLPKKARDYVTSKIISDSDYKIEIEGLKLGEPVETVGEYKYTVKTKTQIREGKIKVVDTKAPEVEVQNLTVGKDEGYRLDDFVVSCKDYSMPCNVTTKDDKDYEDVGTYNIDLIISDNQGNKTEKKVTLTIKEGYSRTDTLMNDTKIAKTEPEYKDFIEEYAFKLFDKAIPEGEDNEAEKFLLNLLEEDLNKYIPDEYAGTHIVANETIELFNKSGYTVGYAFRATLSNGEIVYLKNK